MLKYQYLLFDMDGTLVDTDEMLIQTMHILYDKYRNGIYTPKEKIYYFSGPPIEKTLKEEFPDMDPSFIKQEFARISKELYPTTIKVYLHSREVLLELKNKGVKLGVVTNKLHDMTLYCLKLLNLEDIFDVVIGYDDVKIGKPNKEGILKALDILKAKDLNKSIYIGDNIVDLDSANNADIDCILVNWGPRVLPKDIKPRYFINDYLDLRRIILDE